MKFMLRTALVIASMTVMIFMVSGQSQEYKPVTDQMLQKPSPDDWLHWRRTSDAWGYSPLTQINRTNVNKLEMVWGWSMGDGEQETGPLVHDGVMYLASPGNILDALDAATGDLLWEYRREMQNSTGRRLGAVRNLAVYENKVYMATGDAHVVALDALTGRVVWDTQVADSKEGFYFGAGPLVAKGKVIAGLEGCSRFFKDKCSIVALDPLTGKEIWRTATVSTDPSDKSWGDVPPLLRAGTDMWESGSYDPDLNLIYWPVDQAKPWTRAARGTDGDALYSDSTLALDPDTGKIVWYRQYVPGETHDMDDSFENILVDVGNRKSVFEMGKLGILFETDRKTGKPIRATDLGYQKLVKIDHETGTVSYLPGVMPKLGEAMEMCPSFGGVKSWRSMSYHPDTHAFYIPVELTCQKIVFTDVKHVEGGGGSGQGMRENIPYPPSDGNLGEFMAIDTSGKILWKHRQRAPFNSAALTTAGGLAFVGDWNRYVNAYDVKTGDLLWQTRVGTSPQGFPITYSVRGRQYVAMPIGVGAASWGTSIPIALSPDIKRPSNGNALVVFALPDTTPAAQRATPTATSQASTGSVAAIKAAVAKLPPPVINTSGYGEDSGAAPTAASRGAGAGGRRAAAAAPAPSTPSAQPGTAPGAAGTIWAGVYTDEQAGRGEQLFKGKCSTCHDQGGGGEGAPTITAGGMLLTVWSGQSVSDLFTRIRKTMPQDSPGSLSAENYADIVAYLLKQNAAPAGSQTLKSDEKSLESIKIVKGN